MFIKSINLHNFRRFADLTLEFVPGVNVLCGVNAVGKTTVVEAVYMFARGKSFRCSNDADLQSFERDNGDARTWVSLCAERDGEVNGVSENIYSLMLEKKPSDGSHTDAGRAVKTFYKNRVKASSTASFIGEFRAVLFCPDHLSMIRGASEVRRAFLDQAISQTDKRYITSLGRAASAVKNRSALLKSACDGTISGGELAQSIKPWTELCACEFAFISETRRKYLRDIADDFNRFLREMSGDSVDASLIYHSDGVNDPDPFSNAPVDYSALLECNLNREIAAGRTLFSPSHDDIEIMQSQSGQQAPVAARRFASQGQQRSLAIALKLAEGEYSKRVCGEYPVYLFDDVLSELDETRRRYILSGLEGRQVVITTCTPEQTEGCNANLIGL